MKAPKKKMRIYLLVPVGPQLGRLVSIIDFGTQTNKNGNSGRKVELTYELPCLPIVEDGRMKPMILTEKFPFSMYMSSNLKKRIDNILGTSMTQEEADEFKFETLLGRPVQISVIHKSAVGSDGAKHTYANVDAIMPMVPGTPMPPQVNNSLLLDLDNFNVDTWNGSLSDKLREKIGATPEMQRIIERVKQGLPPNETPEEIAAREEAEAAAEAAAMTIPAPAMQMGGMPYYGATPTAPAPYYAQPAQQQPQGIPHYPQAAPAVAPQNGLGAVAPAQPMYSAPQPTPAPVAQFKAPTGPSFMSAAAPSQMMQPAPVVAPAPAVDPMYRTAVDLMNPPPGYDANKDQAF